VLLRFVLVGNVAGATALGLLALELAQLELLGDGILSHAQTVAPQAGGWGYACHDRRVGAAGHGKQPDPIQPVGLDHVQVAAPPGSEDAARRFYGELLGMAELAKPASLQARGGVWFACGAHQLHVGIAEPFAPAAKAHPAIAVQPPDLDRLAERLATAGCLVQWDDAIPGTRRFYTADPWGNRIELVAGGEGG
jgi:catechol 2,3-dioxygenase-like lactoylglutathione lyase family enzyme